jgi:hypothetical protein
VKEVGPNSGDASSSLRGRRDDKDLKRNLFLALPALNATRLRGLYFTGCFKGRKRMREREEKQERVGHSDVYTCPQISSQLIPTISYLIHMLYPSERMK